MNESSPEKKEDSISFRQFSSRGLPEWQLALIRKYPSLYLEKSPEVLTWYQDCPQKLDLENFCNLRFGFECGPGWAGLIDEFSAVAVALVNALRSSGLQPEARISACIFKEKFGTLHWQGHNNLIKPFKELFFSYTQWIQQKSGSICEESGAFGQLRELQGWVKTLSDEEYQKALKKLRSRERGK